MLGELPEVKGAFRAYDPDNQIIKVRVEYEHADKEHKDDFDRNQKNYKDQINRLGGRNEQLAERVQAGERREASI